MKKTFEHNKTEVCRLCKKNIDTDTDRWNVLIDYNGKKQMVIGFTHVRCMVDLIKGNGKIIAEKFQNRLQNFVSGIFSGGIPKEEDFLGC